MALRNRLRTPILARTAVPILLALVATQAGAALIDIDWGDAGRFERRVSVAPGTFAEVCGKLARADVVAWRFDASDRLDFNVHYHVGRDVHYPERRSAVAGGDGRLEVPQDQDYCWMWSNKSAAAVTLSLVLERRATGR